MIPVCTMGTALNFHLLMTTIFSIASHRPGLHCRGFRQLKPLVRQRPNLFWLDDHYKSNRLNRWNIWFPCLVLNQIDRTPPGIGRSKMERL